MSQQPIVIMGPTAGGKSELAVSLAEQIGGEVIGADSMQVYRHMDVGTAKPEPRLLARAPHHMIDIVDPTEPFTVADWLAGTLDVLRDLESRGRQPVVVGGTNLYIKALVEGLFDAPATDQAFRRELETVDSRTLHDRLKTVDPAAGERIHPNDRKRIIRALEVHHLTGQAISDQQTQWDADAHEIKPGGQSLHAGMNVTMIALRWPTELINRRINLRVKAMFDPQRAREQDFVDWPYDESLPDETQRLEEAGLLGRQAREALGYKQVLAALDGRMKMTDAFEQTKIQTRRFAKQQRTWLRRFHQAHWLDASEVTTEELAKRALALLQQHHPRVL